MIQSWKDLMPRSWSLPDETRVHMDTSEAAAVIAQALYQFGAFRMRSADGLILLCVGTDRSIGDSLGPLVGSYLSQSRPMGVTLFGTLDDPVHAGNLESAVECIQCTFRNPLVIAVDACLGRLESIGMLTVSEGSLRPGAGVNKTLPPVGDIHLTGVVNVGGFMEYFVLQNTRLSLVMRMAKVAAAGIEQGLLALTRVRGVEALPD